MVRIYSNSFWLGYIPSHYVAEQMALHPFQKALWQTNDSYSKIWATTKWNHSHQVFSWQFVSLSFSNNFFFYWKYFSRCPHEYVSKTVDKFPKYYVPGHIPQKQAEYKKRLKQLAITYVAFNIENCNELLVNISGEQIYLFDINQQYSSQIFKFNSYKKLLEENRQDLNGINIWCQTEPTITNLGRECCVIPS